MNPSDTLLDSSRRRPIRLGSVLLVVVILVLGYALIREQRREARLRDALAAYKNQSQGWIVKVLGGYMPLDWPDGTPLEEAIRQIKVFSSRWPGHHFPKGVTIYVDPEALRRAGKTLKSPMKPPLPDPGNNTYTLRERLRSVLEPIGLAYEVTDGAILITTPDAVENPDIAEPEDEGIAP
jgi:hypothetical protein